MQNSDRTEFARLMTGIAELYDKEISEAGLGMWWASLEKFDLDVVRRAINKHIQNPEAGQFMPKPADVIRQLQGTSNDKALEAWSLVLRGIFGDYIAKANKVMFKDKVIHMVVSEMGGFTKMGSCKEQDLHWVQKEFMERYAMRSRRPLEDYPQELATSDYPSSLSPDVLLIIGSGDHPRLELERADGV